MLVRRRTLPRVPRHLARRSSLTREWRQKFARFKSRLYPAVDVRWHDQNYIYSCPEIHTLPCLPTTIPSDPDGTSEDETRIEDPGIYGVYGKSNSNTRPSKAGKKPSIEQCRRWQESIENVLNDSKGEAHFMKFLRKEFASENFEFWNAVKQLKKKNPQGDKLKRDVKQIYDIYIGDHASTPINVNGPLRRAMMEAIDEPNLEMFDDAQKHVVQLMRDDAYKRFISEDNIQDILRGHG